MRRLYTNSGEPVHTFLGASTWFGGTGLAIATFQQWVGRGESQVQEAQIDRNQSVSNIALHIGTGWNAHVNNGMHTLESCEREQELKRSELNRQNLTA